VVFICREINSFSGKEKRKKGENNPHLLFTLSNFPFLLAHATQQQQHQQQQQQHNNINNNAFDYLFFCHEGCLSLIK